MFEGRLGGASYTNVVRETRSLIRCRIYIIYGLAYALMETPNTQHMASYQQHSKHNHQMASGCNVLVGHWQRAELLQLSAKKEELDIQNTFTEISVE